MNVIKVIPVKGDVFYWYDETINIDTLVIFYGKYNLTRRGYTGEWYKSDICMGHVYSKWTYLFNIEDI